MLNILFVIGICIAGVVLYLIMSQYYVTEEYRLEEISRDVNNENKSISRKIKGSYIDVFCENEKVRIICENGNWYYNKNGDKTSIKYDESIPIGNTQIRIVKRKKGGGAAIMALVATCVITVLLLYQQGIEIINNSEIKQNSETDRLLAEEDIKSDISDKDDSYIHESEDLGISDKMNDIPLNNTEVDWDQVQDNGKGMYSLSEEPSEFGFNATQNQKSIDWKEVKESGVDFALIHIGSRSYGKDRTGGEEDLNLDIKFHENMQGAIDNNIKVGTTFYSQACSEEEMEQEIEFMMEAIGNYKLEYPIGISLDREESRRASILSNEECINLIKYFCTRITEEGYVPMIMGREEWYDDFEKGEFDKYLKLVSGENPPSNDMKNCIIWQYKEDAKGVIEGIDDNTAVMLYLSGYNN